MFKPNEHLENAIDTRNITRIRSAFTTIAHEDPSFSSGKFSNSLEYVKSKNIDGLFTEFDQREFKTKEEWDKDYWAIIVSSLLDDFSKERIDHLKEIGQYLYPIVEKTTVSHPQQNVDGSVGQTNTKTSNNSNQSKKVIPIAITAGFAITSIAAIAVGAKGIAATTGIVAIGSAVYTILKE